MELTHARKAGAQQPGLCLVSQLISQPGGLGIVAAIGRDVQVVDGRALRMGECVGVVMWG